MTGRNRRRRLVRILSITLVVAVLSSLLTGSLVVAEDPSSSSPLGWGDDGIKEVGVEWVADFTTCGANDLPNCTQPECVRVYNELRDVGWTGRFNYGNASAYERDWKKSSAGGLENNYVDNVDLALFCSHGSGSWDSFWGKNLSSIYFGSPRDDCHLTPGEAYQAWGDKDAEWVAFFACSVLSDGGPAPYRNRGYWAATMKGLHLLLGMKTTMYCSSTIGEKWAEYMLGRKVWFPFVGWLWVRPPLKVAQAWFEATDDTQPGGVCARVLAEESVYFNDYIHGRGGPAASDSYDGDYTYRDHCSCTPPARQISAEALAQIETMPVYEVVDREVDEQYTLEIAAAFGVSGTVGTDGEYFYVLDNGGGASLLNSTQVETSTLQVDIVTGGYKYRNVSELFVSPDEAPALPTEAEALDISDRFFAGSGRNLPGAPYHTGDILTQVEEQVEVEQIVPEVGVLEERVLQTTPVLFSISYGRVISLEVGTLGGGVAQQTFSVVGPGAREKVYLGDLGDILGVQGGSRDIRATGEHVTIMGADRAWDLYQANPDIALAPIPLNADVISRTAQTLGYYEYPHAQGQQELIPAWIFTADFYDQGVLLAEQDAVYVPAAEQYLPPEVVVDSPAAGTVFTAFELVTFTGSVQQYGTAPFSYKWHSSIDGFLGTGATITVPLTAGVRDTEVMSHDITLRVIDANGQKGADSTTVVVQPTIYLPGITKN